MKKDEIEKKYNQLKKELCQIGYISKGSVVVSYRKCGKPYCKCAKDENSKHGPYYLWTRKVKGKTVTKTLSEKQIGICREFILNHNKLDQIIQKMRELSALNLEFEK